MNKKVGLLISAGNQSRFDSDVPKALVKINGKSLLDLNIKNLEQFCDIVYVVCSNKNHGYFNNYKNLIVIESGQGCGDAVMKALENIIDNYDKTDTCFIQWGDSLQNIKTYSKILKEYSNKVIVPCNYELNPYVSLKQEGMKIKVKFSKYGEITNEGFHDLSVFYGNMNSILNALHEFKSKIFINGNYKHKHGNELQFLDIFNETNLNAEILNMEGTESYCFNTLEEFNKIKEII